MRYQILLLSVLCSLAVNAQNKRNTAFAIVGSDNGRLGWMNIQEIDLTTGEVVRIIFDRAGTKFDLLEASTNKKIPADLVPVIASGTNVSPAALHRLPSSNGADKSLLLSSQKKLQVQATPTFTPASSIPQKRFNRYDNPTATMVAAAAYDTRHNRLYFTPLRFGELRWLNLSERGSSLNVYCLTNEQLSPEPTSVADEANHITRMVIAADGNGYALSNDANFFTMFTTGKKTVVTPLGSVTDDVANTESIHDRKNWGGDMIADARNNLYVIGSNHNVFRIDVRKNVAYFMGGIKGLPANYTTNGAAIDTDGNLIVSSVNGNDGLYKVNFSSLVAEKQNTTNPLSSCSDLATGHFAFNEQVVKPAVTDKIVSRINVFPNPVIDNNFKVEFVGKEPGIYQIQLIDFTGRIVSQRKANVQSKGQTEAFMLDRKPAPGSYMVRVINGLGKLVSTNKLVLD